MLRWLKSLVWLLRNLPLAVEIVRTVRKDIGDLHKKMNLLRKG